jgi:lysophospholipase L1-like esterase
VLGVRIVLLGDSHLARIRRELPRLGENVLNAAVGGATVRDLGKQAADAGLTATDVAVVSVGTNDGAPWKAVPVDAFRRQLGTFLASSDARRWVVVTPPGVDEERLKAHGDRTNAVLNAYRGATVAAAQAASALLVDSADLLRPLGSRAFSDDGLHLSGEGYRRLLPALAAAVS